MDNNVQDMAARSAVLQMPRQAPPIDRTATVSASALGDQPGVQASGWWSDWGKDVLGDLVNIGKQAFR
ncbi:MULTISPECIES: hypothetical protein [Streptomyces]|uniref:Uncharacterized protein n=1 Tax=Streptomyces galilaeus TaxID=33899 RepID=A0ABW9IXB1_STRGJ